MSEGGTGSRTFEKTHAIETPLTMYVNGKVYEGWEDIKVVRELNAMASDFQVQFTDKWKSDSEAWGLEPGLHIHLHAGAKSILTGYIDKLEASVSAGERKLSVSGRSKTGDLVDCSVEDSSQLTGLTLKELASKVCAPFGISVVYIGDAKTSVPSAVVQPGETVFAYLDKLCRRVQAVMYPSVEGALIIAEGPTGRTRAELRQGVNILSGTTVFDNSARHSKYIVKGQNVPNLPGLLAGVQAGGSAVDRGVARYRPLVLINEQSGDSETAETRASHEMNLRAAQALEVNVEVQGWFQAPDVLWDVNQLVRIDAGSLGVRREMLIKKVEYNKNSGGTRAVLTLTRKDVFDYQKPKGKKGEKAKDDKLGWTKYL